MEELNKILEEEYDNQKKEVIKILKEYTEPKVNDDNSVAGYSAEDIADKIIAVFSYPLEK